MEMEVVGAGVAPVLDPTAAARRQAAESIDIDKQGIFEWYTSHTYSTQSLVGDIIDTLCWTLGWAGVAAEVAAAEIFDSKGESRNIQCKKVCRICYIPKYSLSHKTRRRRASTLNFFGNVQDKPQFLNIVGLSTVLDSLI